MGFEQEALDELIEHMRGRGAAMQERLTHSTKGEPLVLHELAVHGTRTPSQLAAAADTTSGRISAVLASLEKKGFITRTTDPNDRRVTLVQHDRGGSGRRPTQLRGALLHRLLGVLPDGRGAHPSTRGPNERIRHYLSLCGPDGARPTQEQIDEAFGASAQGE